MTTAKASFSSVLIALVFGVALTGCGGEGRNSVNGYVPPLLQSAQGSWHTQNGCEYISNGDVIGSAYFDSQFVNNEFIEVATYYSDDYCRDAEVRVRTQYALTVGAQGPNGYGNQVDFFVRSVTMTPLTKAMAYDYNNQADFLCGDGNWLENVERDLAPVGDCTIYNFGSAPVMSERVNDTIRQIMDVDGNAIYMGARGGAGYPTYYNSQPSLVR